MISSYNILGLTLNASLDEVKERFRALAKLHHPDRGGDSEQFKQIYEAYVKIVENYKNEESVQNKFKWSTTDSTPYNLNLDVHHTVELSLHECFFGCTKSILITELNRLIELEIKPGTSNENVLILTGQGKSVYEYVGDLIISFKVLNSSSFQRLDNGDLYTEIELDVFDAMLGGIYNLHNLDDSIIKIKIQKNTENGKLFRLKNKGLPILGSKNRSDLILKVNLKAPKILTHEQFKLVQELKHKMSTQDG